MYKGALKYKAKCRQMRRGRTHCRSERVFYVPCFCSAVLQMYFRRRYISPCHCWWYSFVKMMWRIIIGSWSDECVVKSSNECFFSSVPAFIAISIWGRRVPKNGALEVTERKGHFREFLDGSLETFVYEKSAFVWWRSFGDANSIPFGADHWRSRVSENNGQWLAMICRWSVNCRHEGANSWELKIDLFGYVDVTSVNSLFMRPLFAIKWISYLSHKRFLFFFASRVAVVLKECYTQDQSSAAVRSIAKCLVAICTVEPGK